MERRHRTRNGATHIMKNVFDSLPPVCPKCRKMAEQKETGHGIRSECCGLWSWDGKPLVSAETHLARQRAHAAFDPLWKSGKMTRSGAYRWLQCLVGVGQSPHIGDMDVLTATRIVAACRARAQQ